MEISVLSRKTAQFTTWTSPSIQLCSNVLSDSLSEESHVKCRFLAFSMQYDAVLQGYENSRTRLDCVLSPSKIKNFECEPNLASIKKQRYSPGVCPAPASTPLGMGNHFWASLPMIQSQLYMICAMSADSSMISETKMNWNSRKTEAAASGPSCHAGFGPSWPVKKHKQREHRLTLAQAALCQGLRAIQSWTVQMRNLAKACRSQRHLFSLCLFTDAPKRKYCWCIFCRSPYAHRASALTSDLSQSFAGPPGLTLIISLL